MKVLNLLPRYIPLAFSAGRVSSRPPSKGDLLTLRRAIAALATGRGGYLWLLNKVYNNSLLTDPPPAPPYPDKKHRDKEGISFILKNWSMKRKSPSLRQRFSAVGRGWGGSEYGGLKPILTLLILTIAPVTSIAQEVDTLSYRSSASMYMYDNEQLQQYLQIAAENNPALKAAFYRYSAALQEAPQVGSLPDPEVMFGYFIAPVETRLGPQTARVSIMQMFPWFGTLDARSDAALLQAKAQFAQFKNRRNRLFYRVKEKWYQLYIINRKIETVEDNIEIIETLLDITLQKYKTGTGNQADILQVQIRIEDLKIKKQLLRDEKKVLMREFNELLNTDLERVKGIPSTLKPADLLMRKEQLIARVLENNPTLTSLDYKEESAEAAITAARLSGYPSFGIGAGYMFIGERPVPELENNGNNALVAKLSIKIPLFRDKYEAKKRQAALQKKIVQQRQYTVQNMLITEVERTLRKYKKAVRNYILYSETQIQRLRQAIDVLRQSYAAGETDFEELLRLQEQLLDYLFAKQKALGNQHIAKARIEYLYGKYNVKYK